MWYQACFKWDFPALVSWMLELKDFVTMPKCQNLFCRFLGSESGFSGSSETPVSLYLSEIVFFFFLSHCFFYFYFWLFWHYLSLNSGLALSRKALCHLSHSLSHFALVIFETRPHVFAQTSLNREFFLLMLG
jgi:hypothetical protein